jgi:hypothetical protein
VNAQEAKSRLDLLGRDREWGKRFRRGDANAVQEFRDLSAVIASAPPPAQPQKSVAHEQLDRLRADPAWRKRFAAGDPEAVGQFKDYAGMIHDGENAS